MKIGLDKITIKDLRVQGIGVKELSEIKRGENIQYCLKEDGAIKGVEYLKIIDDKFGCLKIRNKEINGINKNVVILEICRKKGENVIPLKIKEMQKRIKEIADYIEKTYSVVLDVKTATYKEIEINCTMQLKDEYKKYTKLFEVMIDNVPETYKISNAIRSTKDKGNVMYLVKNKSMQFKIYNKTNDIVMKNPNAVIEENLLRLEYSLKQDKNTKKIKKVFDTINVFGENSITQKMIENFFEKQFEKDFVKKIDKNIEKQRKKIVKMLEEEKEKNKNYIQNVWEYIQTKEFKERYGILIDLQIFIEAIKKVDKKNTNRTIKRFVDNRNKELLQEYMQVQNKLNELIMKIKGGKEKIKTSEKQQKYKFKRVKNIKSMEEVKKDWKVLKNKGSICLKWEKKIKKILKNNNTRIIVIKVKK
ncbi:hypothetical protein AN642_00600 [Epulopiscium sp. SCG-B10WGA-EpuloA2]|nr:hypothetical protein AN642_00600 [Epulopiscium sp. SCG-B10WGA-EpuloA2]